MKGGRAGRFYFDPECRRWRDRRGGFAPTLTARRKTDRFGCAVELATLGHVRRARDGFAVESADGAHTYVVSRDGECNCPDRQFRGERCKHTIAAAMASRLPGEALCSNDAGPTVGTAAGRGA